MSDQLQFQFTIKEYQDRYELLQSCTHQRSSHTDFSGILNPKQRSAIISSVKAAPMADPMEVQLNLKNFSPGKHSKHLFRDCSVCSQMLISVTPRSVAFVLWRKTSKGHTAAPWGISWLLNMAKRSITMSINRLVTIHLLPTALPRRHSATMYPFSSAQIIMILEVWVLTRYCSLFQNVRKFWIKF